MCYNVVRGDYMPIIVSRKTGEIVSVPEYTQEQKNKAWEYIVRQNAEKILAGLQPDQNAELERDEFAV